jgi:hypothetical protein
MNKLVMKKTSQAWGILNPEGKLMYETLRGSRVNCLIYFQFNRTNDRKKWRHYKLLGYSCIKVKIEYIEQAKKITELHFQGEVTELK